MTEANWRHALLYFFGFLIPVFGQVALLIYLTISVPCGQRLPQRCSICKESINWFSDSLLEHLKAQHALELIAQRYSLDQTDFQEMVDEVEMVLAG